MSKKPSAKKQARTQARAERAARRRASRDKSYVAITMLTERLTQRGIVMEAGIARAHGEDMVAYCDCDDLRLVLSQHQDGEEDFFRLELGRATTHGQTAAYASVGDVISLSFPVLLDDGMANERYEWVFRCQDTPQAREFFEEIRPKHFPPLTDPESPTSRDHWELVESFIARFLDSKPHPANAES